MAAKTFKETTVYKKAFALAMEIFETTKSFTKEEIYSLTSQIRKSSRSVCSNISEAYRKKLYQAHFISKLQMLIWKIQRQEFGLIFLLLASISMMNCIQD